MTAGWIKFRKKLLRDGRVLEVSRCCHASRVTVIGALVTLWSLGDDYAEPDGRLPGYTTEDIDHEVEIDGFAAALPAEWLEIRDGAIFLPEYHVHNGPTAKQRAQAAARQQRKRQVKGVTQVSRTQRDKTATRLEKSREDKKSCLSPQTPPRKKTPASAPVTIPDELDTREFKIAWKEWELHRREIGKRLTPSTRKKQLARLAAMGTGRAVETIQHSIAQGWCGLFEQNGKGNGRAKPKVGPGQRHPDDAARCGF